jgi:uncharacterized HAD superfamily protein
MDVKNLKSVEAKRPSIAIDVDGVLRDNLGIMVDLYNKEFNDNKSVDEIKDFKTEISFPKILEVTGKTSSHWFFQEHSQEIFVDAKPYENVAEDIKRLKEFADVFIVTYQKTYLNKKQTLEWLEKNGIEPDGICFLRDKTKLHCDIFIDDNDWNFIGCNCNFGVLIKAPYNESVSIENLENNSNCSIIIRKDSFHDFVDDFCKDLEDAYE